MDGTYVLAIDVPETTIDVGALGRLEFTSGTYAYIGSAFGPGGFSRVTRHRELARGERDTRHWHVDYLLGHPETRLEAVYLFPDADRECELAATLPGQPVDAVGASDCRCPAHLTGPTASARLREATLEAGGVRADRHEQ